MSPQPLSPQARAAVPEVAAYLRAEAEQRRGKTVKDGLHVAAFVLEQAAADPHEPTVDADDTYGT